MAIKSDAESVKVLPSDNQNITSEAPKLLLCSSIASGSDLGSNEGVTPLAGIGKEYPELSWYYLYLSNKELKRYISVFSGRKAVRFRTLSGSVEEEFFCFKVFSYTAADHRKRFEQCAYTKEEYTARRDSFFTAFDVFHATLRLPERHRQREIIVHAGDSLHQRAIAVLQPLAI